MKTFVLQSGDATHAMEVDETAYLTETTFEAHVLKCLSKIYPRHVGLVFGGSFNLDGDVRRADLALVAGDLSHWFVIEVELLTHSFDGHVLPQVHAFRYGDLALSCASVFAKALSIEVQVARTLVDRVPREIAVISNGFNDHWSTCLRAIGVQYLSVLPYKSATQAHGYEIQGDLEISRRSVGFGIYDAVASAIRMPEEVDLPNGEQVIEGPDGVLARWTVQRESGRTWLLKVGTRLEIQHQSYVQVMRSSRGRLSLRV